MEDPFALIDWAFCERLRDHPRVQQSIQNFGHVERSEMIGLGQFSEWTCDEIVTDETQHGYIAWAIRQFESGEEPRAEGF